MTNQKDIISKLKELTPILSRKYAIKQLGLFGSFARGDNNASSDVDLLVSFRQKISLLRLVQFEQALSDEIGIKVDLVTESSLKSPRLKHYIYQDLITIFHEE